MCPQFHRLVSLLALKGLSGAFSLPERGGSLTTFAEVHFSSGLNFAFLVDFPCCHGTRFLLRNCHVWQVQGIEDFHNSSYFCTSTIQQPFLLLDPVLEAQVAALICVLVHTASVVTQPREQWSNSSAFNLQELSTLCSSY